MYLTTHDKQDFYRHLGYEFCSPIICFDSAVVPEHLVSYLAAAWQNQQNDCVPSEDSDQPGHPPSLIKVFAVCLMGS